MIKKLFLHASLGSILTVAILAVILKQYPLATLDFMEDILNSIISRQPPPTTHQRYTEGNFVPCRGPLSTTELKVVSGEIPSTLQGTYIRNGANPVYWPPSPGKAHHMFDGESFPHRIRLENGKAVRYDRSWLDSPRYKALVEYGRADVAGGGLQFGDVAALSGFSFLGKAILSMLRVKIGVLPDLPIQYYGTHSTAIVAHHQKLLAAVESSYALAFEIGQQSGALKADVDGAKPFPSDTTVEQTTVFSAHPKISPTTGDMFFVSKTPPKEMPVMVGLSQVSKDGKLLQSLAGPIDVGDGSSPAFVHDFWLTEHFAIFYDASVRFDIKQVFKGGKAMNWNETHNMRFGVLPLDGSVTSFEEDVIWCETNSPGHIWHVINGWETPQLQDNVVGLQLFAPKFSNYSGDIPIHTPEEPPSFLTQWDLMINTATKTCTSTTETKLREEIVERPSTNLRFHGNPNAQWAYLRSEGTEQSAKMGGTILKVNLQTGELAGTFDCDEPCVTGEALFVPRDPEFNKEYPYVGPEGVSEAEDDGYLLDMVYYPGRNASEFVIWDAAASASQTLPIARVALPERVPYGVHAWFAPPNLHSPSF